jgi:hypothetical protein
MLICKCFPSLHEACANNYLGLYFMVRSQITSGSSIKKRYICVHIVLP